MGHRYHPDEAIPLKKHLTWTDKVGKLSLFETIVSDTPQLSKSFRRIAAYIEREREGFMYKTVRELAFIAEVSEPTLIRFCRHYGYKGVPDFRIALAMSLAERDAPEFPRFVDPVIEDKNVVNRVAKRAIARQAAQLARDDKRIILDSGSTTQMMATELRDSEPLTILTTGLNVVQELRPSRQHSIILPGGTFRAESMSLVGRMVETSLSSMHFDTAYLGSDSIDPVVGLSTFNEDEAHQNIAMIAASTRIVVLADASKFSSPALHRICELDKVHIIISDDRLPPETRKLIEEMGVQLLCVGLSLGKKSGGNGVSQH
ncbi:MULTISPECIES: DeoR/GlpR family DNA-binding transcription regulator [unclassified Brenneria]|uniref:DeoR/GlpR family DNA-binding transcription regulator n=1 Tax=unclassified Brenneria TaxID=2634434 RepID=UPI0029C5941C|nr:MULTISPECIES: DeoR/GlpR family DNA-binding transcription regulator [unclassified Brenneria]MDX5628208.1 DeoR/GlpR family DNA-binding transcription regulator [Brenneria sp. L3-3Z]MDX5695609.1 DeoR/GlpR family DNA-binding transcription regulator [Brenneria sp. L4-2C]MEE3662458.1 DeoR/GlpR family DNA-binding transcription regulator [Brenneria sp. g21c3]